MHACMLARWELRCVEAPIAHMLTMYNTLQDIHTFRMQVV